MDSKKNFLALWGAVFIFSFFFVYHSSADTVEDQGTVSVSAYVANSNSVIFSGRACPLCQTFLLLSGSIVDQDACDANSNFQLTSTNITAGSHVFGIYSTDPENNQSGTSSFNADISQGSLTLFSDILISPTLDAESEVVQGNDLIVSGYTVANADVTMILDGGEEVTIQTTASASGFFHHTLSTSSLALGTYSIQAKSEQGDDISPYGRIIEFEIVSEVATDEEEEGDEKNKKQNVCEKADYNKDIRVNIIDFSVLIHWYDKDNVPQRIDLSDDSKVNLKDFSVLVYCWSG